MERIVKRHGLLHTGDFWDRSLSIRMSRGGSPCVSHQGGRSSRLLAGHRTPVSNTLLDHNWELRLIWSRGNPGWRELGLDLKALLCSNCTRSPVSARHRPHSSCPDAKVEDLPQCRVPAVYLSLAFLALLSFVAICRINNLQPVNMACGFDSHPRLQCLQGTSSLLSPRGIRLPIVRKGPDCL